MTPAPSTPTSPPKWRGVNHLALVTSDMDETVRFYAGVLGARLVATVGAPSFRHYFFDFGTNSTLAFFEYRDVEPDSYAKPAGIPVPEAAQFDHLSFDLVDEEALLDLRARLKNANCEVTDVVDHGFIRSIYFTDPNGITPRSIVVDRRSDRSRRALVRRQACLRRPDPVLQSSSSSARRPSERRPATKLAGGFTVKRDDWVSR
jgi:catechol 2,3-dioxygenase-like lactoylglutathione lyase family enzyme